MVLGKNHRDDAWRSWDGLGVHVVDLADLDGPTQNITRSLVSNDDAEQELGRTALAETEGGGRLVAEEWQEQGSSSRDRGAAGEDPGEAQPGPVVAAAGSSGGERARRRWGPWSP